MKSPHVNGLGVVGTRESTLSRWLGLFAICSVVPGVMGWLLGVPRLVQPLATFAPARIGGALLNRNGETPREA